MAWQRLPISAFLRKSEDRVEPEPDRLYKQIRVRLWGKGLTLRGKVPGANIAAHRQVRASAGQFLISRIDARHGAFGIVPDHLDGALVSSDFPCFDIDERAVRPRYLEWYTRTDRFVDLCRRGSEGSTNRVRLNGSQFMDMEIPVPCMSEQRAIVKKLFKLADLQELARNTVRQSERELHAIRSTALRKIVMRAEYRQLGEVAPLVRRQVQIDPHQEYTEIGVKSFYRGIFHRRTMTGSEYAWQKLFMIKSGDLVFSNLMAWEQAIAVASLDDAGCVGNHRMLTCEVDPSAATPEFLLSYFRTEEGFAKVVGLSPGSIARNKTLSSNALTTIRVPVPPIDRQLWFGRLIHQSREFEATRARTLADMEAVIPSALHEVFDGR